jgi:cytochrome c peroxidase
MKVGMKWLVAWVVISGVGCSDPPSTLRDGIFTQADWTKIQTLSPLPEVPANPTNRYADDPAAATLGQKLFFETSYTGAIMRGKVAEGQVGPCCTQEAYSCATCHDPQNYFIQTNAMPNSLSMGVTGWFKRNVPTLLVNSVYLQWNFWDGRRDTIWANAPNSEGDGMRGGRNHIAHMLYAKYKDDYNAIVAGDSKSPPLPDALALDSTEASRFPVDAQPYSHIMANQDAWNAMTQADQDVVNRATANFGKFIDAYVRKLVTRTTPFDDYVAGDETAISLSAKRGLKLFIGKANCIACHSGPTFSDDKFHNTAVAQSGPIATLLPDASTPGFGSLDTGRKGAFLNGMGGPTTYTFRSNGPYSDDPAFRDYSELVETPEQEGQFHTQGLRNIEMTGPYMHAGQFTMLEEVIDLYDRGGDTAGVLGTKDDLIQPLFLSDREKKDLLEFMKTLTATDYPAAELITDTSKHGAVYPALSCQLDFIPQCTKE